MSSVGTVMEARICIAPPGVMAHEALRLLAARDAHYLLVLAGGVVRGVVCACQLGQAGPDTVVPYGAGVEIFGVPEDASLEEAATRMREHGVGCLPVYAVDGKLRGLVTRTDLRRAGISHEALSDLPVCAACHGDRHVRLKDSAGGPAICDECDEGARTQAPEGELGSGD